MSERFQSLKEFWPHYLEEHRSATSRRLHFIGTSGFLAAAAASCALQPLLFPAAAAGMLVISRHGIAAEAKKRSLPHVLAMVALPSVVSPILIPAGIVFAYGCAWIGHFKFEGNRPATFEYPVMSLASDLRMWWQMVRGRLWAGDNPSEQVAAA